MRTSAKPNKLYIYIYIIRKVLMRAIQKLTFIEFDPLCKKLWTFISNFGIFMMPALQIWPCHVTQEANFEKILFFPNSAFRKSYKISGRKALYIRSHQPKTSRGGGNTPHPGAFRVKDYFNVHFTLNCLCDCWQCLCYCLYAPKTIIILRRIDYLQHNVGRFYLQEDFI